MKPRLISWRTKCKGDGHDRGKLAQHELLGPGGWVGDMRVTCYRANKIVAALNKELAASRRRRGVTP